jgi:glycerate 2-kinase
MNDDSLLRVYRETLRLCAPDLLVQRVAERGMPRHVVAIGKCAGPLLDGFARVVDVGDALAAIPEGYRLPGVAAEVVMGGHPQMTEASFAGGRRVIEFVDAHDDVTFLISGGGSACVELPLPPFTEQELIETNARLIASGLPIGEINRVRRERSAIKGGRLGARVRGRSVTLVYSDVSDGALADVASGPTLPGSGQVVLIADNGTLTDTAASLVPRAVRWPGQIEGDVAAAAAALFARATELQQGEVLVAGGEPTVVTRGDGRGGRCIELAVRVALLAAEAGQTSLQALFASSDGVDGNSGAAGVELRGIPPFDAQAARAALARSDSLAIAAAIGNVIMLPPTGNNLRDLFLLAHG